MVFKSSVSVITNGVLNAGGEIDQQALPLRTERQSGNVLDDQSLSRWYFEPGAIGICSGRYVQIYPCLKRKLDCLARNNNRKRVGFIIGEPNDVFGLINTYGRYVDHIYIRCIYYVY